MYSNMHLSHSDYNHTKHLTRDFPTSLHTLHFKIREHQELNVNIQPYTCTP